MMFKRWLNACYRDVPSYRDGLRLEISGVETPVVWLGTIDRIGARLLAETGAKEIPIGFAAWRLTLLDKWDWLPDDRAFVGCLVNNGCFLVLDGQRPLIKPRTNLQGGGAT